MQARYQSGANSLSGRSTCSPEGCIGALSDAADNHPGNFKHSDKDGGFGSDRRLSAADMIVDPPSSAFEMCQRID